MIIFDLKCNPQSHVFEAWFGSSEDFDDQLNRGLLSCPVCGSQAIVKAPMAPRVGSKANRSETGPADVAESEMLKAALAAIALAQREQLRHSDYVGDRFSDEARAIHLGEAETRAIHGQASRSEVQDLANEGIPVVPLLIPAVEPELEN